MYLKSLEISGFKSFAKKSVFNFTASIVAIVGPNGSGKSNVAEAFRFVLGEQSIKSLRGKRGEDLIFNGSKSATRMNRGYAKVTFDNTKRTFNVDFDEVILERVVHRDGVNEYRINGSQVRLKDIFEMLAHANIGASSHHIISQGEADKILSANTKERREMIEDALGLKIFQYKKKESEKKLEKTEKNIESVESLRKEIAPHLRFLRKQMEKIERAKEMRTKLSDMYKEYLLREDTYVALEKKRLDGEKDSPQDELSELDKKYKELKQKVEAESSSDSESEALLKLEEELLLIRNQRGEVARQIGRLEGEVAAEERLIEKEKSQANSKDKVVKLALVENIGREIEEEIEKAEDSDDVSVLKSSIKNIKTKLSDFISSQKTDENLFNVDVEGLEKIRGELKSLEGENKTLEHKEKDLIRELKFKQTELEKVKDDSRSAEREMFAIMSRQNELHNQLNLVKNNLERLKIEEEELKREKAEAAVLVGREVLNYEIPVKGELEDSRTSQQNRRKDIEKVKIRLEEYGGSGAEIEQEHNEAEERDKFLASEIEDLERSAVSLRELISELDLKLNQQFKEGIEKINSQFDKFFKMMFGGGNASLVVLKQKKKKISDDEGIFEEEPEDDEEGIDINVSLPQKRTKGLMMLSGGERALTSIALIFAVSQVNPPPFIILDETDAALDEANSKKYGDIIESLAKHSQLILITHNRETMSRAGVLYGVTMGSDGVSKLLSIKFDQAVAVAK